MNTRIKELRKTLGLTLKEFGAQIGLKPSSMGDIEHGKCNITDRVLLAICARFQANEEWLRNGNGTMFVEENKKFTEFYEIYKQLSPPLQNFLIQTAKNLIETQNKL